MWLPAGISWEDLGKGERLDLGVSGDSHSLDL